MTGCTSGGYDQLETSPEAIEQELRPALQSANADRFKANYSVDLLSSDHFQTDAVVPSSDPSRTETVLPPSDHYCIETVAPSGDHCCIDIVVPSSDHYIVIITKVAPYTDHLYTKRK